MWAATHRATGDGQLDKQGTGEAESTEPQRQAIPIRWFLVCARHDLATSVDESNSVTFEYCVAGRIDPDPL
jgi:hypothetical protein